MASSGWSTFEVILLDGIETSFISCKSCFKLYNINSGRAVLTSHQCKASKDKSSSKTPTPLSKEEKEKLKTLAVLVCAAELRPFALFDGNAMKAFNKQLIEVGANHGNVSLRSVSFCKYYLLGEK